MTDEPTPDNPPADDPTGEPAAGPEVDPDGDHPETFPRSYVEELRRSEAGYRTRAKQSDTLAAALVTSYAAQTGRLADPSDLPYDAEALCDEDGVPDAGKVAAAVDALLTVKPHLATRRPVGDVGQGARPDTTGVSLAGMLRAGAG